MNHIYSLLAPLLGLTLALLGAPAKAQTQPDRWTSRPLAIEGQLGVLGSPIGLAGVNLDYTPIEPLSVTLGGGAGGGKTLAPQFALMARYRFGTSESTRWTVGAGASGGPFVPVLQGLFQGGDYTQERWEIAYWANAEVGLDIRTEGGVTVRPMLGFSYLLNKNDAECVKVVDGKEQGDYHSCASGPYKSSDGLLLPYLGIAVGYAFTL